MNPEQLFNILQTPKGVALALFFFGASIFVHELGHFLAARKRGLKIECFSIGFGPALWKRKDREGVEWRLSAIPLGGYVRLPQLAEMQGLEGDAETATPLPPISFADKMIVSVMGAVFNLLFAFLIGGVLWVTKEQVSDAASTTVVGFVQEDFEEKEGAPRLPTPAQAAGLRPGDSILEVDGERMKGFDEVEMAIALGLGRASDGRPEARLRILREGQEFDLTVHPVVRTVRGDDKIRWLGAYAAQRLVIDGIFENSPALRAGLAIGDEILGANGSKLHSVAQLNELVRQEPPQPIVLQVQNREGIREVSLLPAIAEREGKKVPMLGLSFSQANTWARIPPWERMYDSVKLTIKTLVALIHRGSSVGVDGLGGPIQIGSLLIRAAIADFRWMLSLTALINVNLAILNLLPIPVLDGGHMAFATIAKILGRPLPARLIQASQSAFAVLLLGLMLYVGYRDVVRTGHDLKAHQEMKNAVPANSDPVFHQDDGEKPVTPPVQP